MPRASSRSSSASGAGTLIPVGRAQLARAEDQPLAEPLAATSQAASQLAEVLAGGGYAVLACEPDAEGVLTAVGASYLAHADPTRIRLASANALQPMLGEQVISVPTDVDFALRVHAGFERTCAHGCPKAKGGRCRGGCAGACVRRIAYACASDSPAMPEVVHRYVRRGFAVGPALRDMVSHPDVAPMMDLSLSVSSECEKTRQFVRFSHMSDGSYLGVFRPKANTLPLTSGYFAARMGTERFCLVDPVHRVAAFHDGQLAVVRLEAELCEELASRDDLAADEQYVRAMWRRFYDRLELAGRRKEQRGYDLRMQFMPKRLWEGLTELDPRSLDAGTYVPERYAGHEPAGSEPMVLPGGAVPGLPA